MRMKCPIDNTALQMTERQGIEIDYCLSCRGVWLDRGELDKIIDRDGASGDADEAGPAGGRRDNQDERGGFLENIFDFM